MKKKWNNLKTRLKKYFTEKPKSDFWKGAFITLFLFSFVTPKVLVFLSMMQVGLITPDLDPGLMDSTHHKIAEKLANNYVDLLYKIVESGQNISQNNPIMGKVLFYAMSNCIWVIWVAMVILLLNLFRFGAYWVYRRLKRNG